MALFSSRVVGWKMFDIYEFKMYENIKSEIVEHLMSRFSYHMTIK